MANKIKNIEGAVARFNTWARNKLGIADKYLQAKGNALPRDYSTIKGAVIHIEQSQFLNDFPKIPELTKVFKFYERKFQTPLEAIEIKNIGIYRNPSR